MMVLCVSLVGAGLPALTQAAKGTLHVSAGEDTTNVGRLWEQKLSPDTVVFTRGFFVNCVGQRRQFELYNLDAFSPGYGERTFSKPKSPVELARYAVSQPRRQPSRTEWFR